MASSWRRRQKVLCLLCDSLAGAQEDLADMMVMICLVLSASVIVQVLPAFSRSRNGSTKPFHDCKAGFHKPQTNADLSAGRFVPTLISWLSAALGRCDATICDILSHDILPRLMHCWHDVWSCLISQTDQQPRQLQHTMDSKRKRISLATRS